ncbi:MAG: hypothetical protein U5R31_05880 [Acidimicrobiia bacterium]|nr:hypothetical protein [Acidimicrobiia bacterium]
MAAPREGGGTGGGGGAGEGGAPAAAATTGVAAAARARVSPAVARGPAASPRAARSPPTPRRPPATGHRTTVPARADVSMPDIDEFVNAPDRGWSDGHTDPSPQETAGAPVADADPGIDPSVAWDVNPHHVPADTEVDASMLPEDRGDIDLGRLGLHPDHGPGHQVRTGPPTIETPTRSPVVASRAARCSRRHMATPPNAWTGPGVERDRTHEL